MNPASHARAQKEARPQDYCAQKDCLWNTRVRPCRNHPVAVSPLEEVDPSEGAKFAVVEPNISPSITE